MIGLDEYVEHKKTTKQKKHSKCRIAVLYRMIVLLMVSCAANQGTWFG